MDIHFQGMGSRQHTYERPGSDIKKSGYLRKLKTMKKKFFVLRSTSSSGPARLEYYDSEKKFQSGNLPKRSVQLHTCFNINKKSDSRNGKYGIVLYTVPDSFILLAEVEEEQEAWLRIMLEYQNEYIPDGDLHKEHYEHVWQVTMQPRGLGQGKGLKGPYRLCLNSSTVSLFKINTVQPQFAIQLVTIRAVAHHENSFWLEVGNYASTGPGAFWFTVEGTDAAKGVHTTILQYMNSVKDIFHKEHQFVHASSKRDNHTSFHDDFGGPFQLLLEPRKSFASWSGCPEDGLPFMTDFTVNHHDTLTDFGASDFDGEVSAYLGMQDLTSLKGHHSSQSSHTSSMHSHNFSELPHLPTVKEGGSGEGFLLSDLPTSTSSSSDFPRPEPAACMLSDDSADLPPRTYSLGSRPTKKLCYAETGSRKVIGNEMSRATSAPHILKGRRERELVAAESPTPTASLLSMSMKSDDSDSFMENMSMRPRTASDSFNYRPRTSSFGKLQQTCRPRSSSYGQGKRPVININKLNLERALMSHDHSQRTSRESSLQGSFESLRVSRESLRRTSQELRQQGGSNAGERSDMRGTPSPKMRNITSDSDSCIGMQGGAGKRKSSPHRTRADSIGSGRPQDMTRGSDHQHHYTRSQQLGDYYNMAPLSSSGGSSSGQKHANMDYNTRHCDTKTVNTASQSQSSHQEGLRSMKMDFCNNNKCDEGRSSSMDNVDTYFICDFNQAGNPPRTGSWGSKDKQIFRSESVKKSVSSSTPSSSGVTHHPPHPLVLSSSHNFGSSDSIRKVPRQSSTDKFAVLGKDFRKKSGSTGSRPTTMKTSLSMGIGKELPISSVGIIPLKKQSPSRFSEEEPTFESIEFPTATTICDNHSSDVPHSGLPMTYAKPGGPHTSNEGITSVHSTSLSISSSHAHHPQQQYSQSCYHPSQLNNPATSSSLLSQTKHIRPVHVVCQQVIPSNPVPSHLFNQRNIEDIMDEYIEFDCGVIPSAISVPSATSQDYGPGIVASSSVRPPAPCSVVSYIQSSKGLGNVGVNKLKQQQLSLDAAMSVNRSASHLLDMDVNQTNIKDYPNQPRCTYSAAQSMLPPVPPLPLSTMSHQTLSSKQVGKDENKSMNAYPESVKGTSQDNNINPSNVVSNLTATSQCPQFPLDSKTARFLCTDVKNSPQEQLRYHQQSFQRQLSAPVYSSVATNQPVNVLRELQPLVPSPKTQSSDKTCTTSNSSVSNILLSTGSGNKHLSRTSNSFQKSGSITSPNSDRPCPGGDKSPAVIAGKDLSPSQKMNKFTCETSSSKLKTSECMLVPTKAKARRSLGDIMSVIGTEHNESQGNRSGCDVSISGDPHAALRSRSRHSISDLGSYKHMIPPGLASLHYTTPGYRISGDGDSSGGT